MDDKESMTVFNFRLPRSLLARLHAESAKRGITTAGYIRMAILDYMGKI
ncbi:hypothetical protein [Streptococcus sp. sy010]|nr:hypothetical protein [Streptococcus sp. sy010]